MNSFLKDCCTDEWIEFIRHHRTTETYRKKNKIFEAGAPVEGLFFIVEGKVKVVANNDGDDSRLIRLAGSGDILGHRGINNDLIYPVSAIALTDIEVDIIPMSIFNVVAKTNPTFSYKLMMLFAEELRRSEDRSDMLPVANRLAKAIYRNIEAFGMDSKEKNKLSYTLSNKDFASMAGTTYESTIRTMSSLKKDKIIDVIGKEIYLLDKTKLEALAMEGI